MVPRFGAALAAIVFLLAAAGAQPRPAAGAAMDPTDPGTIRLEANCLDLCTVTVSLSGNGSGSWQSTNSAYAPNGLINCAWLNGLQVAGSDCTQVYGGVDRASPFRLYYKITPSVGSEGCLEGTCGSNPTQNSFDLPSFPGPTSTILSASFKLLKYRVDVVLAGTGSGQVQSSPPVFNCPGICAVNIAYGTHVTLNAGYLGGSYFAGWSGACAGQPASCELTVTGATSTTATFTPGSPPTASPPAPTPTAPLATPKATVKPTATPRANASTAPLATAPGASGASPTASSESGAPTSQSPASAAPGSLDPLASAGQTSLAPSSPPGTEPPDIPVGTSGSDLTPIVLAILGAGLLIAIGIGFAAVMLRRKSPPPA